MDGRHGEKQSQSKCKHDQQRQQDGYALNTHQIRIKGGGAISKKNSRLLFTVSKPREAQFSASGIEQTIYLGYNNATIDV